MLRRIRCDDCGWVSDEEGAEARFERGVPWYCDNCGKRVHRFIEFEPSERAAVAVMWEL